MYHQRCKKLRDTILTLRSCTYMLTIATRTFSVLFAYLIQAIPRSQALFIFLWNGQQERAVMFRYEALFTIFFLPFEAFLIWNCNQMCQFRFERTAAGRSFQLWLTIKFNPTKISKNVTILFACILFSYILFLYLFILV